MGQVFTWRQIRDRHVPQLADFALVLQRLRNRLSNEISVVAAGVCGSVIRGDHNCRSDIDCIVIHDAQQRQQAFAAMQALSAYARQYYVPLAFIVSDTRLVATRMHHFGPSFVEHFAFSIRDGGLIKGTPLEMLAPSVGRRAGIEEYLRFKLHYLQAHWAEYSALNEQQKVDFLKKTLEAPLHVARKVLSWFESLAGDSKQYVREHYSKTMPNSLNKMLVNLCNYDAAYSAELERQLKRPLEIEYRSLLQVIENDVVPEVFEFVISNLEHIAQEAR